MVHNKRYWWVVLIWMGWSAILKGQDSTLLQHLDNRITHFQQNGAIDSLLHYTLKKGQYFKQHDQLSEWAGAFFDLHDYLLFQQERPGAALPYLDTIIRNAWRTPGEEERPLFFWVHYYRAYDLQQQGLIIKAIEAFENALQWHRLAGIKDFDLVEYVYKPLGNDYTRLGDNRKAIRIFEKALALAKQQDNKASLPGLYNNLGLAFWNQKDYDSAAAVFRQALLLDPLSERMRGLLLSSLARNDLDAGREAEALQTAREALRIFRRLPPDAQVRDWLAGTQYVLGLAWLKQEQYAKAVEYLTESLRNSQPEDGFGYDRKSGKRYIALGNLSIAKGKPQEALQYFDDALRCVLPSFQPAEPESLPDPKSFHEENTILEGLEGKAVAFRRLYGESADTTLLTKALRSYELAQLEERLLWNTYDYRDSKIQLQAESRRRSEAAIATALTLFRHSGQQEYLRRAFRFAEQSKASVLLEGIRVNLALQEVGRGDSLILKQQQLQQQLAFLQKQAQIEPPPSLSDALLTERQKERNAVEEALERISRQIAERYPAMQHLTQWQQPVSVEDIAAYLQNQACDAMLEYFAGETAFYAFLIDRDGKIQVEAIPQTPALKAMLKAFTADFANPGLIASAPAAYLDRAYRLYEAIYEPAVRSIVANTPSVIIVPDGTLNFVPFEALVERPGSQHLGRAPYLIRRQQTRYAYSATILLFQSARQAGNGKPLLLMAPLFQERQRGLPPLPFSGEEVREIHRLVAGDRLLTQNEASLAAFRELAPQFRILHLSTHAQADTAGVTPRIEFADSTLHLPELYALNLKAELVVLSSCQTGIGREEKGEGLMSLARGFTYAGSAGLIASLWQLNDRATSSILQCFYRSLEAGQPPSAALHFAKINYLEDASVHQAHKSPYYWAGLTLIGRDQPVTLVAAPTEKYWLYFLLAALLAVLVIRWFWRNRQER